MITGDEKGYGGGSAQGGSAPPAFDYDVFISYAHLDNEPLIEGEPGWVTDFHTILEKRLGMLLGERPRIWRDPALRGNQYFDNTIASGIQSAALFISVVTPRYVRSDYCRKELLGFCMKAEAECGAELADRCRLLKVVKTPVDLTEQPPPMERLLGYEFYRFDPETRRLREFRVRSPEERERFLAGIEDLAEEIKEALSLLNSGKTSAVSTDERPAQTVYLAPVCSDCHDAYALLRRELLARSYRVLPERPPPLEIDELRTAMQEDLAEADLAIHILGERYGVVPEGTEQSVVHIQTEASLAESRRRPLERVIWYPPGIAATDARQNALLTALRTDSEYLGNAELLETRIEELKSVVLDRLEQQRRAAKKAATVVPPSCAEATDDGSPLWMYLMHPPGDSEAVAPLLDFLWDRGFEVRTPLLEGSESEIREAHEEYLQVCDAFVIYYGAGNERWIRKMLTDLKRAKGLGCVNPILGQAIWVASPDSPQKQRFRTLEAEVLRAKTSPGFAALETYLTTVAKR